MTCESPGLMRTALWAPVNILTHMYPIRTSGSLRGWEGEGERDGSVDEPAAEPLVLVLSIIDTVRTSKKPGIGRSLRPAWGGP